MNACTRWGGLLVAVAALATLTLVGTAGAEGKVPQDRAARGRQLYLAQCAVCHGSRGRGDGPAAYLLFPKPRDFTAGKFKLRSTPSGQPPTDQDLLRTISEGMPGSAMPSFATLPTGDRRDLVAYVKALASLGQRVGTPLAPTTAPVASPETLARGKGLYRDLECFACHGDRGRGDGPSTATLKDDWGYPALPADFTRGQFKGGGEARDLYLRFTSGMDGTPMPSYADSIDEADRWALAFYVRGLNGGRSAPPPTPGPIVAARVRALPTSPADPAWESAPTSRLRLMTLWQRPGAPETIAVRAVHDGRRLALLLEWEDSDVSGGIIRPQEFADAAAVQFALEPTPPRFTMGEAGRPVYLWLWRLDRQLDLPGLRDVEATYPAMVADDAVLARGAYPKAADGSAQHPIPPALAHDPAFLTGSAVGNPLSTPIRLSAVEELNAEGFGTLTAQPPEEQATGGLGYWVAGTWRVMLGRALDTRSRLDARFKPGSELPVAFAVWDGGRGDRDGQKSVTTWTTLRLAP